MSKKNADAKMSKGKFALNVALIVLQVVIVVVAIAFSISILLSTGYESNTDFGKSSIRLMPVLTDSMAGDKPDSFKAGDLIIVKSAEKADLSALEEGDIITYLDYVGGDIQFVTHRIISIKETPLTDGTIVREFTTMGDAEDPATAVPKTLYQGDIKGVYIGKLAGVGSAVFWLQDPTHFFLVIMLPLILLLIYNAYLVVRIIIEAKLKKQREQLVGATAKGAAQLDEEEIKRRAIEEYLKAHGGAPQSESAETVAEANAENKTEESTEETTAEEKTVESDAVAEEAQGENKEESAEYAVKEPEEVQEEEQTQQEAPETAEVAESAESGKVEETYVEPEEKVEESALPAEETEPVKEEKPVKKPAAKKTTTAKKPAAKTTAKSGTKTAAKKPAAKATAEKPEKKTTKSATKTSAAKTTAAKKSTAKTTTKKTTAKKD